MVWFYAAADDLLIIRNLHAVFMDMMGSGFLKHTIFHGVPEPRRLLPAKNAS